MQNDLQKFKTKELAKGVIAALYDTYPELTLFDQHMPEAGSFDGLPPDDVSVMILDLTSIMARISVIVTEVVSSYDEAYAFRKHYEYHQYHSLRDKNSQGDSEWYAKEMTYEQRQDELVASFVADVLKGKERAGWQMISSLQSRLGLLKQERTYSR